MLLGSLFTALAGFAAWAAALDAVEVYGSKFFNKDGSQFFIKGVAYQLLPNDPLVDAEQCKLDVKLMKELGVNTIRVYHVDAKADHDGCMRALADAGVYLLVDLDTFGTYIEPVTLQWNKTQYDAYSKVMDAFQKYDNTLGFFVGNENIATKDSSVAAPLLKAAARDMKAYRDAKGYRKIPVGYSAADIKELRPSLQDYLTCGGKHEEIVDFFGLNSYSWCDPSTFEQSTYNQLQEYAQGFPVPIFFTETGCNVPGPRRWEDMDAIFGEKMVNDWSGAIAYEWIQEQNNYGLVEYHPSAADAAAGFVVGRNGTPNPRNPDFTNLKSKWAASRPSGVAKAKYDTKAISTRPCPTPSGWWQVNGDIKLPTLGEHVSAPASSSSSSSSAGSSSSRSPSPKPTPGPSSKAGASTSTSTSTSTGASPTKPAGPTSTRKADEGSATMSQRQLLFAWLGVGSAMVFMYL